MINVEGSKEKRKGSPEKRQRATDVTMTDTLGIAGENCGTNGTEISMKRSKVKAKRNIFFICR